ncbi:MAG TPA: ABC transporter permease [Limnochordia bacterium]|nr:ABC transporter permease [Limnochordia bacterium]
MPKRFYPKLAVSSIRRHFQVYGPYLGACTVMVSMFYLIMFLAANSGLSGMFGASTLKLLFTFGTVVVGLFAVIFLFYTNSFLIRRRKKELGLFNVLGLEKRHIARILVWETLLTAAFSLAVGLGGGILLSKILLLVLLRILDFPVVIGFEVPEAAVLTTLKLFGTLFLVLLAYGVRQVGRANPRELLQAEAVGEREPKARWFLALLGLASLGAGYFLALAIDHPLDALVYFFVAVLLVIAGTYLLFTTGSIALLKLLRRSKRFYYRSKPFLAVSGMLYRMKQNGVGLANICILSTMVLVTLSTTVSLYVGLEDVLRTRYPRQIVLRLDSYDSEVMAPVQSAVAATLERHGLEAVDRVEYRFLSFPVFRVGDTFSTDRELLSGFAGSMASLQLTPLEDYNRLVAEPVSLEENEVLVFYNRQPYEHATVQLLDRTFVVKGRLTSLPGNGLSTTEAFGAYYLVVRDLGVMEELAQHPALPWRGALPTYTLGFDLNTSRERAVAFYNDLKNALPRQEAAPVWVESRDEARGEFHVLYGGLFFLGAFLGTLFVMGTVLIIYYKQITEGFEDRRRYLILRQVGMSSLEVRSSIKSQVLSVFFLPLAAAGVHVAFAFPMITKLLVVLNLSNRSLFALCTALTFAAFALLYTLVYRATTRVYYRLAAA